MALAKVKMLLRKSGKRPRLFLLSQNAAGAVSNLAIKTRNKFINPLILSNKIRGSALKKTR
jgi:hypothetical protein